MGKFLTRLLTDITWSVEREWDSGNQLVGGEAHEEGKKWRALYSTLRGVKLVEAWSRLDLMHT